MFREAHSRPVLNTVSDLLSINPDQSRLLRHHTNAVYAFPDAGILVKIARPGTDAERLRKVMALVAWLTELKFPTVGLLGGLAQPQIIDGYAVTTWELLDPADENPVTAAELGQLLRQLHRLPTPPVQLPTIEPFSDIAQSLDQSVILDADQKSFLSDHARQLQAGYTKLILSAGTGLIHADPQRRNALRRNDGSPVLADWDTAAWGPREWDLATVEVHCRRFPDTPGSYDDFVASYGYELRTSPAYSTITATRELKMICTNARKSAPGTPAAAEVLHRVKALRAGHNQAQWNLI